jgi:hypothetical protein
MDGVKEDVLEIILNLKGLRVKCHSEEPVKLTLKATGEGKAAAGDIGKNADVEIVNPELVIATLTSPKASLEMEITVARGRGWVPTENRMKEPKDLGTINIDSLFSPVRNVGYKVENTRVGEITNYDKLTMTIETDGSISPQEAVEASVKILTDYFSVFMKTAAGRVGRRGDGGLILDYAAPEERKDLGEGKGRARGPASPSRDQRHPVREGEDHRGQGQGGEAARREDDHDREARHAREPSEAPRVLLHGSPGPQDPRGRRSALCHPSGRLHAHHEDRPARGRQGGDGPDRTGLI